MFVGILMAVAASQKPYLAPLEVDRLILAAKRVELDGCNAAVSMTEVKAKVMTRRALDAEEKLALFVKMFCALSAVCAIVFRKEIFDR